MRLCYLLAVVAALCPAGLLAACGGGESGVTVASNHQSSSQRSGETNRHSRNEEREARALEGQRQRRIAREERIEAGPSGIDPIAAEEFHYFSGTDRSNWEIAYGVCAVTPERQLAKEFHTSQNWADIGHAYGQGYREPFNIAAEEGCMVALKDSHAQREAAFKMMEAAER